MSQKDEAELRNALLLKYLLDNDAPDNLLYSFLHFYSTRTSVWYMSLSEKGLIKPINKRGGKKKALILFHSEVVKTQMARVLHLIQKVTLWLVAKCCLAFLLIS